MSNPTATARAALVDLAKANQAAGRTREQADEALTSVCHADYIGLLNDVLDEVYRPAPICDLANAGAKVATLDVLSAINLIAADWRAGARNIRPTCDEDPCYGHEGDDEVAETIADVYDEVALTLLRAFGFDDEDRYHDPLHETPEEV